MQTINIMEVSEKDKAEFDEVFNNLGIFMYFNDGFEVILDGQRGRISWQSVVGMIGYKRDLYAIDCICLDVLCEGHPPFAINEQTPGWFQFVKRSKAVFKQISEDWEIKITIPPFEPNLTLVYDRQGRSLADFMEVEYPKPKPSLLSKLLSRVQSWFG
jgi:hypothetical protein